MSKMLKNAGVIFKNYSYSFFLVVRLKFGSCIMVQCQGKDAYSKKEALAIYFQ